MDFSILNSGFYSKNQIKVSYHEGESDHSGLSQKETDECWRLLLKRATREGKELYDSEILNLNYFHLNGNSIHLELGKTSYKVFVTSWHLGKASNDLINPLGSSAVVITSDEYILWAKRNEAAYTNPNKYYLIGGFLTPGDIKNKNHLFDGILREINEETAIPSKSITDIKCIGLIYDNLIPHSEICFRVNINLSYKKVATLSLGKSDFNELIPLKNSRSVIDSWITNNREDTVNTAVGCLTLYSQQFFN